MPCHGSRNNNNNNKVAVLPEEHEYGKWWNEKSRRKKSYYPWTHARNDRSWFRSYTVCGVLVVRNAVLHSGLGRLFIVYSIIVAQGWWSDDRDPGYLQPCVHTFHFLSLLKALNNTHISCWPCCRKSCVLFSLSSSSRVFTCSCKEHWFLVKNYFQFNLVQGTVYLESSKSDQPLLSSNDNPKVEWNFSHDCSPLSIETRDRCLRLMKESQKTALRGTGTVQ